MCRVCGLHVWVWQVGRMHVQLAEWAASAGGPRGRGRGRSRGAALGPARREHAALRQELRALRRRPCGTTPPQWTIDTATCTADLPARAGHGLNKKYHVFFLLL